MDKAKEILKRLITFLDKEQDSCPIGLKSLGLRVEYLDKVYKNHYSSQRFFETTISPVKESPFFLM